MNFKAIQNATLLSGLIGISIVMFWLLRPYFYPLFWAAVLAVIFHPVYLWVLHRVKQRPTIAASITLVIIILAVIIPCAAMISIIVQQAISLYQQFDSSNTVTNTLQFIQQSIQHPVVQEFIARPDFQERVSSVTSTASQFLYTVVTIGGQTTVRVIIQSFIMLYTLYYFLKDGPYFLERLKHLLPLGDAAEEKLYQRFVSTTRATLKGTLLIGTIQGVLGGVGFVVVGLPAAAFWGLIMILLSIIPGVGPMLVLLPTAIYLFVTGQIWQGCVIIGMMCLVGIVDNLLRAPLVGKDTQLHPLLIFFATLGGLLAFGASGIIIGPIIMAFGVSIWGIYEHKYHRQLENN